jgi:WD40 repeat protein
VSFSSGNLYVFNHELPCAPTAPVYQVFKQGPAEGGFAVYTCKAKSTRNPLYKWAVGHGAINQFAFSPCGHFLATASQDGYMRLFNYDSMELVGLARSYFGGFTCVCWSPDGRYIACGGEDDLVTIYSVVENRIVVRGQGHKSWVSQVRAATNIHQSRPWSTTDLSMQVAFDDFNMSYGDVPDGLDFSGSDEEGSSGGGGMMNGGGCARPSHVVTRGQAPPLEPGGDQQRVACYRLGSVGEDAHLCLWDLTEDLL